MGRKAVQNETIQQRNADPDPFNIPDLPTITDEDLAGLDVDLTADLEACIVDLQKDIERFYSADLWAELKTPVSQPISTKKQVSREKTKG